MKPANALCTMMADNRSVSIAIYRAQILQWDFMGGYYYFIICTWNNNYYKNRMILFHEKDALCTKNMSRVC